MKTALYPRLAWDGLRKNKRLFTPYLLTCVCMVMMFYILSFLGSPETCALLPRGSNTTGEILNLGSFVIFVFSAIFLYYTNSFLVRRREREFGLYNVLGMNKRNLARIVTWESLITAVLSLVLGLALGIVLSKLAELGLVNMLGGDINYRIRIDVDSLTRALGLYAVIMKRNGAGLASVCIIATMILVMISSSSCLYFGAEDSANMRYPRDINITLAGETPEQITDGNIERYRRAIADYTSERGVPPKDVQNYRYINTSGLFSGDTVQCWFSREGASASYSYSELRDIYIVSSADYAARTGENVSLAPDEVLLLTYKCSYDRPTLTLAMDDVSHTWRVADVRNGYFLPPEVGGLIAQMTLIVNDTASAVQDFRTYNGHVVTMQYKWVYNFNTDLGDEECVALTQGVLRTLGEVEPEQGYMYLLAECRADGSADFYGSNGALFFIGIMLTLVFMLAAVLILYYKQISEGYEDQKRFEIMQKVGMTKKEIRRSIDSQLLTVFFLPLLLAGVHLAFAFPMIRRLLELFSLYNVGLFVTTTLVSFGAFALLYTIVYRLTAKAYYNIVSA